MVDIRGRRVTSPAEPDPLMSIEPIQSLERPFKPRQRRSPFTGADGRATPWQRPPLKWAGNKYRILSRILPLIPEDTQVLVEPFVGAGAVFLNSSCPQIYLGDSNGDLMGLYHWAQKNVDRLLEKTQTFFVADNNTPEIYYALRQEFNQTRDVLTRAALFIYFNRHGYNGLCRYNRQGEFNVPFGRYRAPSLPESELRALAQRLQAADEVRCHTGDFEKLFQSLPDHTVIYADPPYAPLTQSSNFTSYSGGGFDLTDQIRLAKAARKAAKRGATVILSNHDTPWTRKLYTDATEIQDFAVPRTISCQGNGRQPVGELLAIYRP